MGPIDEATIRGLLTSGQISIDTLVWTTGMSSWVPLQQSSLGTGLPTNTMTETAPTSTAPKSRTVYILLAVFLGAYGVHNFFAGDKKAGLIKLLVTFLTCFIGALPMGI